MFTESFARLKQRFHYAEYGGAPLLGVNGVSIIAHGRSDARAIASAVRVAKKMVVAEFNQHISDAMRGLRSDGQTGTSGITSGVSPGESSGGEKQESQEENPATSRLE